MESGIVRIPPAASVDSVLGLKESQMGGLGEGPRKEIKLCKQNKSISGEREQSNVRKGLGVDSCWWDLVSSYWRAT